MTSPLARYAMVTIGVVAVVGALLSLAFHGPRDSAAVWLSGVVAVLVQLGAASLALTVGRGNLTARMGLGALIRFFALIAYALVVVFVVKLPMVAALLSLFLFFFLTTLIEPLLIKS